VIDWEYLVRFRNALLLLTLFLTAACKSIPAPSKKQVTSADEATNYFQSHQATDPILRKATDEARQRLREMVPDSAKLSGPLDLYVTAFEDLPPTLYSYGTNNCTASLTGLRNPSVICNSKYLQQAEIAIRAFEEAGPLLQREDTLLQFVRSVKVAPQENLDRLRTDQKLAAISDQSSEHIGLHLMLALLFFASHELGHLMDGVDFSAYGDIQAAAHEDAFDEQVRSAVLKMCRQTDDFRQAGFDLQGFDSEGIFWSKKIQNIRENFRQQVIQTDTAITRQFAQEDRADTFATQAILRYLSKVERADPEAAIEQQHLLFETLFVLGIFTWYRDLATFMDATCGHQFSSAALNLCMMQDRHRYIEASAVFGDVHRFVLLRALLNMRAIIEQRRATFEPPGGPTAPPPTLDAIKRMGKREALREVGRIGDIQRYEFLDIIMDTPIKFAFTGCATGWYMEVDKERGTPQLLVLEFDTLEDALQRLTGSRNSTVSKSRLSPLHPPQGRSQPLAPSQKPEVWEPHGAFFDQILRLQSGPVVTQVIRDPLFKFHGEPGIAEFGEEKLPYTLTFACDYDSHEEDDSITKKRQCVSDLLHDFVRHLESRGLLVKVVADKSEVGWTRVLLAARDRTALRFNFLFESERNPSDSMGYSQIRILKLR
jgi:hypothetical protein